MMQRIGVIADDFTGASDAASFLVNAGVSTTLYSGVPESIQSESNAIVIALKSRTQETEKAVADSLLALRALIKAGIDHFYIKYCSTFDSKPHGNIGPIVDALMDEIGASATVLAPSLPVNGRTVTKGVLYVNGVPLAESPMKDHPITPMWASSIKELMKDQGKYEVQELATATATSEKIGRILEEQRGKVYFVPDYATDEDGKRIIELFGEYPILTGGSALVGEWGKKMGMNRSLPCSYSEGGTLLLAGSCSAATREQIKCWINSGRKAVKIFPQELMTDFNATINKALACVADDPVLIYTSASPEEVEKIQHAYPLIYEVIEKAIANIAVRSKEKGIRKWIVAGGETSGAVTKAMGFKSFVIGESIAPGVPVMIPQEDTGKRIVLKSGNFGQIDFFDRAVRALSSND